MALSDPQSITISGSAISLPRVSTGDNSSSYLSADGNVRLTLSSQYTNNSRIRRNLRVDHTKITADPFVPAQNREVSMSQYMVFDVPRVGYSAAEVKAVHDGFEALITASSDVIITKLLGGES